jgi:hypothetical protein
VDFENDDYHSAPANTVKEANKLIDAEFEYVALATTQYSSENASKRHTIVRGNDRKGF